MCPVRHNEGRIGNSESGLKGDPCCAHEQRLTMAARYVAGSRLVVGCRHRSQATEWIWCNDAAGMVQFTYPRARQLHAEVGGAGIVALDVELKLGLASECTLLPTKGRGSTC